ncbi:CmpA/NrtA family ABC transporter substrate-binding protein [Microvirga lotononidis]|uniref:ABC-type nitrate/sulfonate/bicarbonate transport system, periplasmic component n=1 Tax=Microvirga lotononidis TaxID=864069 RepID=I4YRW0_9HYPH|nr:CmpA/NrtA family ABC transporter substrate-binding protein [Microvirga lotononidis]EIM26702.1 ABC-type nitrate/sulfonate/bicarbonate transport system, periplasmic component [Microvirga lotononidis]WQO31620.1 CmpA/NrtA family ABC transporter substrate-binding protein [Microvirga lotononidis]
MWDLEEAGSRPIQQAGSADDTPARTERRSTPERLVRVGFIPLVDMAVLVAAAEQGFARREGIRLQLIRDVSWSNIRDRLAFRQFDVAHMLSPMPIASQLHLGSNPYPCFTPFALGRGGNAITLSVELYREMQAVADLDGTEDALGNGRALKQVIERRQQAGRKPLVFAMTYPFSSHNYEFRFWLAAAGINPDADVTMTVVPPPLTVDAMAARAIDGFCVNAPWNMIAVEKGVGRMVATKADIWPSAPEKVLGVSPEWAEENPDTLPRLIVALDAAARWCDDRQNHGALADMMADPAYLGVSSEMIQRLLAGELTVDPDGRTRQVQSYMTFHDGAANFPWISQALWIYSQMVRWGQVAYDQVGLSQVRSAYRPNLYREVLGPSAAVPSADVRVEGAGPERFMDGRSFMPDDIPGYVAGFTIINDASASVAE